MSRRPNPGADRAAQNAQTLKALVKLEGNKVCADCKKNKHPRWASWNLGIFVCIRCSGIHRGMGTHISRVKSVDLDAWTDEQLQSVIKWGNTRANTYWEAKLAAGHVPSEAKIENFIRTKYDSKRWAMDGPMPDPSTLAGDEDVPLNIVQEKAIIDRSASQRVVSDQQQSLRQSRPAQNVNLFDDFTPDPPARPSTTEPPTVKANANPPPVAKSKPSEALLGFDFLGQNAGAGIGRPTSAASNPASATNVRGDLKNSILSLYASAPKPQPQSAAHARGPSFGDMQTPQAAPKDAFGGLTDAFGDLDFSSGKVATLPAVQPSSTGLAGLSFPSSIPAKTAPAATQVTAPAPLSGGSFFDGGSSKPAPKQATTTTTTTSNGLDFSFAQNPVSAPAPAPPPKQTMSSMPADLFADDGFDAFAAAPSKPAVSRTAPPPAVANPAPAPPTAGLSDLNSAFNLSAATSTPQKTQQSAVRPAFATQASSSMFDPWAAGGDSNAWGASESTPAKVTSNTVSLGSVPTHLTPNDISGGWGAPISNANKTSAQPTVTGDEDFGGWTSAPAPAPAPSATTSKPGAGFGGASDPFDNPWG